jgi:transcriptional regulator with XRE-family HTH domain
MHEVCDDLQIPAGHGRQSSLGRMFGVTAKAARKWLEGEGYPEMDLAIRIADRAKVNINWLLQGVGPKSSVSDDQQAIALAETVESLPANDSQQVLDFIRYKMERADGPLAGERLTRYMKMLDSFASDMARKRDPGHR